MKRSDNEVLEITKEKGVRKASLYSCSRDEVSKPTEANSIMSRPFLKVFAWWNQNGRLASVHSD